MIDSHHRASKSSVDMLFLVLINTCSVELRAIKSDLYTTGNVSLQFHFILVK